jgi:nucleoside-diphosphate-sugar epimerase
VQIFVTGGSGFIGGHAIEAFVAAGHRVRALARSARAEATVRGFGAEPVAGDLATLGRGALAGCDAVVHAAAYVEEWGTRAQFFEANVTGTQRALTAAREAGVKRFVHVGTEAVLFCGHDLVDVDESAPYPARHRYLYSETKAEAERRVLAANDAGFTTLSIRPRFVWGPRDASVLPTVLRKVREGSFAWIDGGRALTSTTHVANLVHALGLALTAGRGGHAYFVADEGTRTVREVLTALARTEGVELPTGSVPSAVVRPLAWAVEACWRLFGVAKAPPVTRFAADMMASSITLRTDAARADLGYAPVISFERGIAELTAR